MREAAILGLCHFNKKGRHARATTRAREAFPFQSSSYFRPSGHQRNLCNMRKAANDLAELFSIGWRGGGRRKWKWRRRWRRVEATVGQLANYVSRPYHHVISVVPCSALLRPSIKATPSTVTANIVNHSWNIATENDF